jgi:hypothetical protein
VQNRASQTGIDGLSCRKAGVAAKSWLRAKAESFPGVAYLQQGQQVREGAEFGGFLRSATILLRRINEICS